jgi:alkylation response protein AidB-like acyl-CoA dehydrogenase
MNPIHAFEPAAPEISRKRADAVIAWLRDYAETRIDSRLFDERRCVPPFVILDMGNKGLMGMQVPEAYGGLALNNRDFLRVLEQLAAIDISLASLIFIHNGNGVRPIMGYAKPALREELLPILAQGRELSAFGLTEPAAGSNLPGLQSRATPDGAGGWRLHGVKRWNASGWAGIISVFCRTVDERGRLGHVTGFVVRQGMPGLRYGPESLTMGVRSIMQNSLIMDGVLVEDSHVLGEVGKGMELADEALLIARLCMGAISLGAMKRCAQLMLRYASRREVSTGRLLDSPITLSVFDAVTIRIAAVQALVDRLVAPLDAGGYPAEEACMIAKIVASDSLWETADDLVQTLGGRGFMENNPAAQILRDCRMLRIGEGANELMTLSVGRRVTHSEPLRRMVCDELGAPHLHEVMTESAETAMARCLAAEGRFATRGDAVAWAHSLTGEVAIAAVLLATVEAAARTAPSPALAAARDWADMRLEAARRRATEGAFGEDRLADSAAVVSRIAAYAAEIGDLEQAPPGVEEGLDPMLQRTPNKGGFAPFAHLPGSANGETSAAPAAVGDPELDKKRRLAAVLLKKRMTESAG